ncbi:MAG: acyl-CoA desaturase [Sumerlaeia bacterium]
MIEHGAYFQPTDGSGLSEEVEWKSSLPFLAVHLACLLVFVSGFSWIAFGTCIALYIVRMFGITGAYHRYFSHRTYKTSRWFQFALAWLGASSGQMGPLWWAAHHRHHHRHSDTEEDPHSPGLKGFFISHMGWIMVPKNGVTNLNAVRDLAKFPELRWINRHYIVPPVVLLLVVTYAGLAMYLMGWPVTPLQMMVWGFFISTVLLYHGTFCINSLAHVWGRKRFKTGDDSRNSFLLAVVTLGEGWHNNHHRYPGSVRNGFYWWEFDPTHYTLRFLSWLGLVWDLRDVPESIFAEARSIAEIQQAGLRPPERDAA